MIMMMTMTMTVTIMTVMAEMLMNTTTTMTHMTNVWFCLANGYAYMLQVILPKCRNAKLYTAAVHSTQSFAFALAIGRLLTWPCAGCFAFALAMGRLLTATWPWAGC